MRMLVVCGMSCGFLMMAGNIRVANKQDATRYVGVYNYNRISGNASRISEVVAIAPANTDDISYKNLGWFQRLSHTQLLVHSDKEDDIAKSMAKDAFNTLPSIPVDGRQEVQITSDEPATRIHDYVEVANETEQPWFVAMYTVPHAKDRIAQRFSAVLRVGPGESVSLPRPHASFTQRLTRDRMIIFHESQEALGKELSYRDRRQLPYIQAGVTHGTTFFLAQDIDNGTRGYNIFTWKTRSISETARKGAQALYEAVVDPRVQAVRQKYLGPEYNPWYDQVADVRTDRNMQKDEASILSKRDQKIRKAISQLLGRQLSENEPTPRVALVCSGGGFRAMFATLGTMRGAHASGVWDALSYVAGLSGSTWAISPYMVSKQAVPDYVNAAIQRATGGFRYLYSDIRNSYAEIRDLLGTQMLRRLGFQQTLSLIDPYGFALGRYLLHNTLCNATSCAQPDTINLADQQKRVADGNEPFPLYTAVVGQTSQAQERSDYTWIFFSPYEVGANALGGHIPSWGFGRKYSAGRSINRAPTYNLGYCMGIWGSAFSASLQDAYEMMLKDINIPIVQKVFRGLADVRLGNKRMLPARVPNMTYNMQDAPMSARKYISLIDGGYASNIPVPAVVAPEREADVIIMLDVSGGLTDISGLEELDIALQYARNNGVTMPEIDREKAFNNVASRFTTDDAQAPALVYMPLIGNTNYPQLDPRDVLRNDGFLRTSNFFYSPSQAQQFVDLCAQNMQDAVDTIRGAIEHVLKQRTPQAEGSAA